MIKVLIVDDSRVVREVLKDILSDSGIEVIGEASDGKQAIDLARDLKPDLITMDVMMPVMDGLTAVEQIMAYYPTPILVFASSLNRKDVNIAFEAIQLGALDVVEKPDNLSTDGMKEMRGTLIHKIRLLSNIKVIRHIKGRRRNRIIEAPPAIEKAPISEQKIKVVAIGASTGGPKAVMSLFKQLPENLPTPILLVQHIGANFTQGFVDWLDRESPLNVKMAEEGEKIRSGTVFVGPGERHLETVGDHVKLTSGPMVNNCRPSVDVLFSSVAKSFGEQSLAVLLTGMGRDGAEGMLDIKKRKGTTIVQDEQSSTIFGMPKAAIELGVADKVVPLNDIPKEIVKITGAGHGKNTSGGR